MPAGPTSQPRARLSRPVIVMLLTAAMLVGALALLGRPPWARLAPAAAPPAAREVAPSHEPGVVRLADPRQRQRIVVSEAVAEAVPLTASMPARLDYDENATARLATPVDGRVVRLEHQIGDPVKAGETLMRIDAPDLAAAIADADRARNDSDLKRAALARAQELESAGVMPRKDLEAAHNEAANAAAELKRANLRLRGLNAGRSVRGEYYALTTPITGVITERNATIGQQVRADAGAAQIVVTDPRRLALVIEAPEEVALQLHVGTQVAFAVDAWPAETFRAEVVRIGPQVDAATRRVPVRAVLANPGLRLRPEMFARAWAVDTQRRTGVRIPVSALLTAGGRPTVFVQREPGIYERREVTVAAQQPDSAWLSEGVKEGEQVISAGALLLEAELVGS